MEMRFIKLFPLNCERNDDSSDLFSIGVGSLMENEDTRLIFVGWYILYDLTYRFYPVDISLFKKIEKREGCQLKHV